LVVVCDVVCIGAVRLAGSTSFWLPSFSYFWTLGWYKPEFLNLILKLSSFSMVDYEYTVRWIKRRALSELLK
jgi:hypothetical protein